MGQLRVQHCRTQEKCYMNVMRTLCFEVYGFTSRGETSLWLLCQSIIGLIVTIINTNTHHITKIVKWN